MAPDLVFSVDVDFTDRRFDLVTRRFTRYTHRVVVLAETDVDATQAAAQIVACCIADDDMVTATRIVGVAA